MNTVEKMKNKVLKGELITKAEALELFDAPLEELCVAADDVRESFCGERFDICTIINGKCGKCSEDCKYCAQSAHYNTSLSESFPLVSTEQILEGAKYNAEKGVLRYSIVTSGRRLSPEEIDQACESIKRVKSEVDIEICVSFGLLEETDFIKLKEAGVSRIHCNLETSDRYFKEVCTTHTYEEKISTIKAAKKSGLSVCSGGIIGLGESIEDRIDMVLTARELGVKSIPVNVLNAIPGTPYENNTVLTNDEVRRTVAVFRFLIPDGNIRLAGGRGLLGDKGEACFRGGANAAISGDMLTTAGITVDTDMKMLYNLGYEVRL